MGQPFWPEGITYARKAAEAGVPQASTYLFGQLLGDATFRNQAPELARDAIRAGWSLDPLPNAPGILQQGDPATAIALIEAAAVPRPYPEAWEALLKNANADLEALRNAAGDVANKRDAAISDITTSGAAVDQQQAQVEKRAHALLNLIEQATTAQATSHFEQEATRYGGEAKWLWRSGLAVVILTALVAVAPLIIYYVDRATGHATWLHGSQLLAAHLAPVAALGAVAGVLLARARGRDRARQRNRDLSVALQTMFAYSESIENEGDRQTFIREMGGAVIVAFLRQEAPVDADRSLLAAMRSPLTLLAGRPRRCSGYRPPRRLLCRACPT